MSTRSPKVPVGPLCLLGAALSSAGCMWDRFEELQADAPVIELERPSEIPGAFGSKFAKVVGEDLGLVYVAGADPTSTAAVYSIGRSETPTPEALDTSHCEDAANRSCSLAQQPAGLRTWPRGSGIEENCFVSGIGTIESSSGLYTRCMDSTIFLIPIPDDVTSDLVEPLTAGEVPPEVWLTADDSEEPLLVAAAPEQSRAWFYPPGTQDPVDLRPAGETGESFGSSLAVARGADEDLIFVGAPKAGQLWLFRSRAGTPESLGCLGGPERLGRALATGDVNGDEVDDVAVASADSVSVYSGSALARLPSIPEGEAVECSLASLPSDALLTSFTCGTSEEIADCPRSDFGAALTMGDFNGDDELEIAVGAPDMTVREEKEAGAVLVYDAGGELLDVSVVSNAAAQDGFGTSLVSMPQESRDVLVVGAPGANRTNVVYCATVSDGSLSPRCGGSP